MGASLGRIAGDFFAIVQLVQTAPEAHRPPPASLRSQLLAALDAFLKHPDAAHVAPEELGEARFALIVWADEALLSTEWQGRDEWAHDLLQMQLLRTNRGGNEFFDHLAALPPDQTQARLVYFHSESDFSAYDAIIVDPVIVWDAEQAGPARDPADESERQADYFRRALREHLADVYQLVEVSNPRTLRLRVAIVEGASSRVNIECELIHSVSREPLIAAVDQRKLPTASAGETRAAGAAADTADTAD